MQLFWEVSCNKRCSSSGVVSPLLFNVYVDELSDCLNKSGIGGSMNGTIINHMLYADDICIIFISSPGLQQLLNICSGYSELHDLTFNAKKSMCMYFSTSMNKHCGCPVIYLGNSICEFVKEVKYLDVMIHSSKKTTIDVARQTRKFYLQANLLLRVFYFRRIVPIYTVVNCGSILQRVA